MASPGARVLKWLGLLVAGLFALLVVAAVGLWVWAGSEGSVDWALRYAARSQPLQAEGVRGSLRKGFTAQRLRWEKEGVTLEARGAEMAWQPLSLIRGTLRLDRLVAAQIRFEDRRPPQPSTGPPELRLPLRVEIGELRVGHVQWVTAATTFDVRGIAGSYSYNALRHQVKLSSLQWMGGSYSGEATLGVHDRLPLAANLQGRFAADVPGSGAKVPLSFAATLGGPLTEFEAQARLRGEPGTPTANTVADVQARVTPWGPQPVQQAQAKFTALDVGALWPQAPRTALNGNASVQPAGTGTWTISAQVDNAQPGPWDKRLLPVSRANARGEWRPGGALVRELQATVGGGELRAQGEWKTEGAWAITGELARVDPAALHSAMASVPLSGQAEVEGEGEAIGFDVNLRGHGPVKAAGGLELRTLRAEGKWNEGLLTLPSLDVRTADATLVANLEARPDAKSGRGKATLKAPGLEAQVDGRIAERAGGGKASIAVANATQALRWLARIPGVPKEALGAVASGRGQVILDWQGGWADPTVQAAATVPVLELAGPEPRWRVTDAFSIVSGRLADAAVQLRGRAVQGQRTVDLQVAGRAGRRDARSNAWQGRVDTLQVAASEPAIGTGTWTLALQRPVEWRMAGGRIEAGAGEARLASPRAADAPAQLVWDPVRWGDGQLRTAGRLSGLPLGWIEFFGGPQLAGSALSGDMVFDAQWNAQLGATPRIEASLVRSRGDLTVLAEGLDGQATRVPAGVKEARLAVTTEGDQLTATLDWDSERGGTARARVQSRLARGGDAGWSWPADAPLSGTLQAQLPRIGVWSVLAPPGWRLRGSLVADVKVAGTRSDPRLAGTVSADDLALRSVVDGIELQGGRLRARLDGQRLLVDEFVLRGPGTDGGMVTATGEGGLTAQGPQVRLSANVDRLRASIRSDRQLTVSGTLAARRDASGTNVDGKLRVDQALIVLPDERTPQLGDDVVVRNAPGPVTRREARAATVAQRPQDTKFQANVQVDLGSNFRVRGMGVDTRLAGNLAITGQSLTSPRIVGVIRTVGGEYRAYGQRLDIERGVIRFTGVPDNPALDVLAVRPRLVQRVGVQVTGTAQAPFVRLYAEPDLPDAEKLAWLITGRAAPASGAETALVQQAAVALLAARAGGGGPGIAQRLGLDELSFRREGPGGPAVTLGKRFTDRLYAAYERGLSGAVGTLYLFYDITGKLTLRAQAGERTALDVIYTFEFDRRQGARNAESSRSR